MSETPVPTREILWNIQDHWIMYPCLFLALAVFVYFLLRKRHLWSIGKPVDRSAQPLRRLGGVFRDALLQATVLREKGPGILHLGLYVSMAILLVATASIALQADLGIPVVQGTYYLVFLSLIVDIAGLVLIVCAVVCIVMRVVSTKRARNTKPSDMILLIMLIIIGISGFILEALRIVGTGDAWRAWSPIGNLVSNVFAGMGYRQVVMLYQVIWWGHMLCAFALVACWSQSKLVHILLIPKGIYHRSLEPKGTLPFIDVEDEDLETLGVGKLEDFTWKDLYDTETCVRCGRCQDNCPAFLTGKALSPQALMQDLRSHLEERIPVLPVLRGSTAPSVDMEKTHASVPEDQGVIGSKTLVGDVISPDALWACTTCLSCMEQCPALLEHVPKVVKMRTYQVSMESAFPHEAQLVFRNLEKNGNPWGLGAQKRLDWAVGLGVQTVDEHPDAEYLYWPGCSGSFDSRNRKVSTALVKLMQEAGVDFAVLGSAEKCCGDAARRLGNEYVYYLLAQENIASMNAHGVRKIITQCPHCYHTLTVDYPQLGGHYEVIHHTELLKRLFDDGRLVMAPRVSRTVTYHDSCYLGRYHHVYDAPRDLLRAAGDTVVEMDRTLGKSFCCGAGGGRFWLEETGTSRINEARVGQAIETRASEIATACPFCLTMLSDGISSVGSTVEVKDVAEILLEARG